MLRECCQKPHSFPFFSSLGGRQREAPSRRLGRSVGRGGQSPPPSVGRRDVESLHEQETGVRHAALGAGILALCLLVFFFRLGAVGLFDADEPAYAEAARQMLLTGDYITPRFNGENRFDKPILFYWLIVLAYTLFGVTEFAVRFFPALSATLLTLSLTLYAWHRWGSRAGLLTGLSFSLSVETVLLARGAVTDMTFVGFLTAALLLFFEAYRSVKEAAVSNQQSGTRWWRPEDRFLLPAYAFLALATLTKGPVAVVLSLLILLAFLSLTGSLPLLRRLLLSPAGIVLFLLLTLPWYGVILIRHGGEFLRLFIVKHHLTRFWGVVSGHGGSFFYYLPYYLPVLFLGFFPWSAFLPAACLRIHPWRVRDLRALEARDQCPLFLLLWLAVVFVFFSVARTKLPNYLFPAFPALALLVGWGEGIERPGENLPGEEKTGWSQPISLILLGLLGGVMAALFVFSPSLLTAFQRQAGEILSEMPPVTGLLYSLAGLFALGTVGALLLLGRGRQLRAWSVLAGMMGVVLLLAVSRGVPTVHAVLQGALREFADRARMGLSPDGTLVLFGLNRPSVVFYAEHPVVTIGGTDQERLNTVLSSSTRVYLITRPEFLPRLSREGRIFLLKKRGGYALYSTHPEEPGEGRRGVY